MWPLCPARPGCCHFLLVLWVKPVHGLSKIQGRPPHCPSARRNGGHRAKGMAVGEGTEWDKAMVPHNSCPGSMAYRFSIKTAHGSMMGLHVRFPPHILSLHSFVSGQTGLPRTFQRLPHSLVSLRLSQTGPWALGPLQPCYSSCSLRASFCRCSCVPEWICWIRHCPF